MKTVVFECPDDIDFVKLSHDSKALKYNEKLVKQATLTSIKLNTIITSKTDILYFDLLITPMSSFQSILAIQETNSNRQYSTPIRSNEITGETLRLHSIIDINCFSSASYRFTLLFDPLLSRFYVISNGMFIKKGYMKLISNKDYKLVFYTDLCSLDLQLDEICEVNKPSLSHYLETRQHRIKSKSLVISKSGSGLGIYSLHTKLKEFLAQNHQVLPSDKKENEYSKMFSASTSHIRDFFVKSGLTRCVEAFDKENDGLFTLDNTPKNNRVIELIRTKKCLIVECLNVFDTKPLELMLEIIGKNIGSELAGVIDSYIKLMRTFAAVTKIKPDQSIPDDLQISLDTFTRLEGYVFETSEIEMIKKFFAAVINEGDVDKAQEIKEMFFDKNQWILEIVINSCKQNK
eukprot:GAHX01000563.1.p1 GENE.GAHX01000563.1~~GAHX01000563.1.p1  ORF type:complete len:415 (+),score=50.88 GAHX01000563.1:34-1245(+)